MNPNPSNSSSSGIAPSAFGRDSDDFVMIDEPSSAAYNSHTNNNSTNYNNNNSNNNNPTWKTSEAGAGGRDSGTSPSAHWYSGSPNTTGGTPLLTDPGVGGGGILTEMTSTQQQQQQLQQSNSEALQLSQCAHRCQYISSVVVAMTKHADSLVKTILAKHGKTISKEMDREAILGGGGAGAGGEGERDRDRDSPRQRSSTASSGGSDGYNIFSSSNQQLENNLQLLSEALCVPFSFYLHCMNYVQDAIQRTVSLKQQYQHQHQQTDSNMALHDNSPPSSSSPPPPSSSSYFLDQLDGLVSGLTQRFDQLMGRAEGCQRWIRADASPPPRPEPLIYQAALKMGQEAAVEELLGNLKLACAHYWDAKLLVECVLLSASEAGDRRVLQGYAKMFLDQFVVCEKSSALLDYDRGGGGSYSFEHKSQSLPPSPGSNSSFESHVSMNSNNNTPNQNTRNSPLLNNHYG